MGLNDIYRLYMLYGRWHETCIENYIYVIYNIYILQQIYDIFVIRIIECIKVLKYNKKAWKK